MSKAIRKSTTLLSVIGGCFYTMDRNKMFSRVDVRESVAEGYNKTIYALKQWPKASDDEKTVQWVRKILDRWEPHVHSIKNLHRAVIMAKVCRRCINDLLEKNKSKEKQVLLLPLVDHISLVNTFTDENDYNFTANVKCDELMDYLYELIEW